MKYPYIKRLSELEYLKPKTIDDALAILSKYKGEAKILAGGTDLLIKIKKREETPQYLVGLKNIPHLDYIKYDEKQGLRFGPLVTIHTIENFPLIREKFPILSQAASTMASAQVRNMGTIIGNLCSAVPSADMAPGLIVLGANLEIVSAMGKRTIALEYFFTGPSQSALGSDELVVGVQAPNPPPNSGMAYIKHTLRAAMELAIVGVGVLITAQNGICSELKICLGAVAPTPVRATKAENILKGKALSAELVKRAAQAASEEACPISDIRASAEYRKEMVRVLTQRAIDKATQEIK